MDRQQERKAQWNEVQVVAMLLRDANTQAEIKADCGASSEDTLGKAAE